MDNSSLSLLKDIPIILTNIFFIYFFCRHIHICRIYFFIFSCGQKMFLRWKKFAYEIFLHKGEHLAINLSEIRTHLNRDCWGESYLYACIFFTESEKKGFLAHTLMNKFPYAQFYEIIYMLQISFGRFKISLYFIYYHFLFVCTIYLFSHCKRVYLLYSCI